MRRFWTDESGATSIEYGLICLLIFLVIVTAVRGVSTQVSGQFNAVSNGMTSAR
jgi:pilus assembly protein Flp/PilA